MARYPLAEWHPVGYDGGAYAGLPFRIVLHTVESSRVDGALAEFATHYAPHFVVDGDKVYQLIDTVNAAAALRHVGSPETNRLSAIQIEMVGFAGRPKSQALLDRVRPLLRWIEATHGVPRVWPNGPCKPAVNGQDPGGHNRSVAGWMRGGFFGHEHVPNNTHWDPALTPGEQAFLMADEVAPAPIPPAPSAAKTHTVVAGQTLWAIARIYNTTVAKIVAANHLANPNAIAVGQTLIIPA